MASRSRLEPRGDHRPGPWVREREREPINQPCRAESALAACRIGEERGVVGGLSAGAFGLTLSGSKLTRIDPEGLHGRRVARTEGKVDNGRDALVGKERQPLDDLLIDIYCVGSRSLQSV